MQFLDWLIVGTYLLMCVLLGLYFTKRALRSVDDFFASGRSLPWWLAGISMTASAFSIDTPIGITGLIAKDGIPGVWYAWSFVLGGAGTLGAFIFAPLLRRSRIITTAELIELRYAGRQAAFLRGFKGVYFGILANAITLGWIIKAVWTLAAVLLPGVNQHLLALGLMGIVLIYAAAAGLWGIAATEFFQFIVGSFGSFILAYFAWQHIGGAGELVNAFILKYGAADASARLSFLPMPGTPFFVTFIVFITIKWWGNPPPAITQRIIASKDEKNASFATMLFTILAFGFNYWPMIFAGMVSIVAFPQAASPEAGYAMLIVKLLPTGFLGIMIASLMAAFMSTVDAHINFGASYMVNDIYRRFIKKDGSEKHYVRASQISTVIMLLVSIAIAYNTESVSGAWYYLAMLTAGYGIVIVVRWFWWRVNAWAEITALAASGIASTLLSPKFAALAGYSAFLPEFDWNIRFIIVVVLCTISWVIVCFLTEPDPDEHLKNFCLKVKPYRTFWGPVYRKYPELPYRKGFWTACMRWAIGSAMVFSFCFGLGHLMFLRFTEGGVLLSMAAVFALIILGTWKRRDSDPEEVLVSEQMSTDSVSN